MPFSCFIKALCNVTLTYLAWKPHALVEQEEENPSASLLLFFSPSLCDLSVLMWLECPASGGAPLHSMCIHGRCDRYLPKPPTLSERDCSAPVSLLCHGHRRTLNWRTDSILGDDFYQSSVSLESRPMTHSIRPHSLGNPYTVTLPH